MVAKSESKRMSLHKNAASNRLSPVDILVFGHSAIGKFYLLKAITDDSTIQTSPELDHSTQNLQSFSKRFGKLMFRFWDSNGIVLLVSEE